MSANLRAVGAALLIASTMASLVALISILAGLPRVWPGTILAFASGFGWGLLMFGRRR